MRKVAAVFCIAFLIIASKEVLTASKSDIIRQTKFAPCKACRLFVESFKKGMDMTARGNFEGGDAAWEEEKLGSYAVSEIRLIEIQEHVCSDLEKGRDQCYSILEEFDEVIADWWLHHQHEHPDLFQYFCVDFLKNCCHKYHYGPQCKSCPGFPGKTCNNAGKCNGYGTRKGTGLCTCNPGYTGDNCNKCSENYFESYKDDNMVLCLKCHPACDGSCTKAAPTGCHKCVAGWIKDEQKGCMDVNECASPTSVCGPRQFCVNNDGSYTCLECDPACVGCHGDGPDMCTDCVDGYILVDNICIESGYESKKNYMFTTRYLTYLGFCTVTCIVFQRSAVLASMIGLAIAAYISVSEYILRTPPVLNTTELFNKLLIQTN